MKNLITEKRYSSNFVKFLLIISFISFPFLLISCSSNEINDDKYDLIKVGMTRSQAEEIFGEPGELYSYNVSQPYGDTIYSVWEWSNGKTIYRIYCTDDVITSKTKS
jgi:hypothetical protein